MSSLRIFFLLVYLIMFNYVVLYLIVKTFFCSARNMKKNIPYCLCFNNIGDWYIYLGKIAIIYLELWSMVIANIIIFGYVLSNTVFWNIMLITFFSSPFTMLLYVLLNCELFQVRIWNCGQFQVWICIAYNTK